MSESCDGEWSSQCVGCGGHIQDQFILRVSPDLSWHAACLKCSECQMFLDENCTCFVRDGKTYCKKDYVRLYGARCSACQSVFTKNDFVMRAKTKMFHLECFRCAACRRHLVPGDEFALRGEGIYCKEDHEVLQNSDKTEANNNVNIKNEMEDGSDDIYNNDVKSETSTRAESPDGVDGDQLDQPWDEVPDGSGKGRGRSTRARTVLTEKQRNILTTCFQHNHKPDALLKEQLVEMTGLTARVIRVWFQNKRCKEHKRIKAAVLVNRKDRKLGYGGMNGIPMVASSPVRHESPLGSAPIEIQSYHPPWKALTDFALHTDIDRLDPAANPHFSSLLSQMHGYDPQYGPGVGGVPLHDMYPPHLPPYPHDGPLPPHDGAPPLQSLHDGGILPGHDGHPHDGHLHPGDGHDVEDYPNNYITDNNDKQDSDT